MSALFLLRATLFRLIVGGATECGCRVKSLACVGIVGASFLTKVGGAGVGAATGVEDGTGAVPLEGREWTVRGRDRFGIAAVFRAVDDNVVVVAREEGDSRCCGGTRECFGAAFSACGCGFFASWTSSSFFNSLTRGGTGVTASGSGSAPSFFWLTVALWLRLAVSLLLFVSRVRM